MIAVLTPRIALKWGRIAQSVERFVYTEDVGGSSPSSPIQELNYDEYMVSAVSLVD